MYVHMYICMYICTYCLHMIYIIMSDSYKNYKDKSNNDFLCPLCPETF
jgi:hypothetical protein